MLLHGGHVTVSVQTYRTHTTKSDPDVNNGLWEKKTSACRFTRWFGLMGRLCACRDRGMWKLSVPSPPFLL